MLEQDLNQSVIANTKMSLELKQVKSESEQLNISHNKIKNTCKDLAKDNEEMRKVLNSTEGYRNLEETVVQMSGMMVSKKNEHLTPYQKQQLRSIFGNSAILQMLRHKVITSEEQIAQFSAVLGKSFNLNVQQNDIIEGQNQNTLNFDSTRS